ncbi:cell wall-binding repeat-containing protein [Leifsonia sp. NPDC077715]|uniref:cell wall-binding repeat-containing protein n=1 Tax=Leifsonia sp. NPDC077715 TaxID=3155539 RepID=UPI00343BDCD4
MSPRRITVLASALATAALFAVSIPATGAAAATTNLAIPTVPYEAGTSGWYKVTDPITPSTTSYTINLPDGAWEGHGIGTVNYSIFIPFIGTVLSGTATIVSQQVTITLPAGFATAHPAGPDGYSVQLAGYAPLAPSTPHPTREQRPNCDIEPSTAYSLTAGAVVPYSSTPGSSAVTVTFSDSNVTPGSFPSNTTCYWVTPPTPLAVTPGDSFTYTAATPLFTGTWGASIGFGGAGGEGVGPVDMTDSITNGSTVMHATIPAQADLSEIASIPVNTPSILLHQYDKDPVTSVSTSTLIGTPVTIKPWSPTVKRIAGTDRFDTSVALSKAGYPSTAPVVVVATGMNYPDALAAGPAAAKLGGPLLLTASTYLPASVSTEIKRLKPGKIVIVGGLNAVTSAVEQQLKKLAPTVDRVSGSDRFDTARKVVTYAFPTAQKAYVATALNYPDALSAAAAAGAQSDPVVLVNGTTSTIDAPTSALLSSRGIVSVTIVGGTNAVSTGIEASLKSKLGAAKVTRLAGSDRFTTSVLVAKEAFTSSSAAYVATGLQFPDALAGSALAAAKHAPLFTSMPTCLPAGAKQEMKALSVSTVTLIGGVNALSANVAALKTC